MDPDEEGDFTYEGSNIMLPAPWLSDTIMNADTQSPFELIPIVLAAAQAYDEAHPDLTNNDKQFHMPIISAHGRGVQELIEFWKQDWKSMRTMKN